MPSRRSKPPSSRQNFLKRRTLAEGRMQIDAAHIATSRLYCDALRCWRRCTKRSCKRHRRCLGDPADCLLGGLMFAPASRRLKAQKEVIAGGPRRLPPATHIEWVIRRSPLQTLMSWHLGNSPLGKPTAAGGEDF
jgi:hypothetical protein